MLLEIVFFFQNVNININIKPKYDCLQDQKTNKKNPKTKHDVNQNVHRDLQAKKMTAYIH